MDGGSLCSRIGAPDLVLSFACQNWALTHCWSPQVAYTLGWMAVSSLLGYYRLLYGPQILLQMNIACVQLAAVQAAAAWLADFVPGAATFCRPSHCWWRPASWTAGWTTPTVRALPGLAQDVNASSTEVPCVHRGGAHSDSTAAGGSWRLCSCVRCVSLPATELLVSQCSQRRPCTHFELEVAS